MPEKDGDDKEKSTKSVVNKRQKQMMGEEGYDIARDMGRVRPSKDKKDATTMPRSKEMEKTRKVNKGPSALERVKKKYKGQIMKVEELDLTQVAEAFGGHIAEVTRITGGNYKKILSNIKKEKPAEEPPEGRKASGQKRETKEILKDKQDEVIKKGEIAKRAKTFQQSFGTPTGADPITGKPTYKPSTIETEREPTMSNIKTSTKKLAPDTDLPKGRGGKAPTGDQYAAANKIVGLRQKARDTYLDPKTNKASPEGVKKYITKARKMRSGSNMPVDSKTTDVIATSAGKEYADKINQKYGGRRAKLAQKERQPLSDYEKFTRTISRAQNLPPEERAKVNKQLADMPDDPRVRIGDVSGDRIIDKPVMDKKGEPVIDPKTKEPKTRPTEVTASGRTKPFGTLARRAEKAQRTTKTGALTGFAIKTLSPASAGLEAAERLRRGETGMAALSAVQALNIPLVSQAAGVVNALKTYQRGQQAASEPQPKKEPQPQADSGKGGGKSKKPVATSGGKSKEPKPTGDGVGADLDTLQLRQLGQRLPEVGDKLKRLRIPKLVGGKAINVSARGGGAA